MKAEKFEVLSLTKDELNLSDAYKKKLYPIFSYCSCYNLFNKPSFKMVAKQTHGDATTIYGKHIFNGVAKTSSKRYNNFF